MTYIHTYRQTDRQTDRQTEPKYDIDNYVGLQQSFNVQILLISFFQNPELEARIQKLKIAEENAEYKRITRNVDRSVSVFKFLNMHVSFFYLITQIIFYRLISDKM